VTSWVLQIVYMQLLPYDRHIHEDLGVPFFADHSGALTESFCSADAGNPLVRQLGKYLRWSRVNLTHLKRKPRVSKVSLSRQLLWPPDGKLNRAQLALCCYPDRIFRHVSSVVRRMPGYNSKDWARPAFPPRHAASPKCLPPIASLRPRLRHSGFESHTAFQPKYAPPPHTRWSY
jgi:hypothetical protein